MRAASQHTIDLPPLVLRAALTSFDEEQRTVDLAISSGSAVERFDWKTGLRYLEKLEISKRAIRMARLNAGAPLFDTHVRFSVTDQIGAIVMGSARVEPPLVLARAKFSSRDEVAPIIRDVKDEIVRHVSIGYRVYLFSEEPAKNNALPIRTAVDWEPFEVSMVSMPEDLDAHVRSGDKSQTNRCVIVRRPTEDADRMRRYRLAIAAEG